MGETIPRRNVSFEEGLKGEDLKGNKAETTRPKSPLKMPSSDLNIESGWLSTPPSRRSTVDSSLSVTPRSQGSPLPLNFLFRHLSGIKSTLAEAMGVAQMSSNSTSERGSSTSGSLGSRHSYSKVKRRRAKGTAIQAMSSSAIVTSLMLEDEELSESLDEAKVSKPRRRKFFSSIGSKDVYGRQRIVVYRKSWHGDMNFKGREWRHSRRRKRSGCLHGPTEHRKQLLMYSSRWLAMRKWDVQTALGPLLQLGGKQHSGGLGDLTVPKVAESLSYCSDGAWRWQDCVIVGYDSSSGMYRALCGKDAGGEGWSSQDLSGCSTQQESTPKCDSNSGSIGISLDNSPSWRSKVTFSGCSSMELDGQQLTTRLVARLNIRLPEEPRAPRSFNDCDTDWQSTTAGVQPASMREPVNDAEDPSRESSFKALRLHCRLKPEDIPTYGSTLGSVRHGQSFNVPSYCSTLGSVRQGHASEASGYALKEALKPLHGVESRLGVGMNGGTSEKSLSTKRISASGKSGAFMLPGEYNPENLLSWRKKDRPESARCIVYDVFPLLSEIAREFEQAASLAECMDITSLPKAGMLLPDRMRGCGPVRVERHSFTAQSLSLAASAALLQPGLQTAMLLVVDSVKLLEKTRFLAVSVPCVSIAKAIALQNDTIGESTDYIKKRVLADAKDALNTALVRDKGLTTMQNGSNLYIRIARWANILTEAALAKALKGTLDMYAARFEETQTLVFKPEHQYHRVRPLFLIKLCVSGDNTLAYRTPLSKLEFFSGKLLDDVLEALLSLPFMDTKDLAQSKVQRDVLLNAADEVLPICRNRVSLAVYQGTKVVDGLHATLAALWTDFMNVKHKLDAKVRGVASIYQSYLQLGNMKCTIEEDVPIGDVSHQLEKMQESHRAEHSNTFSSCLQDFVYAVQVVLEKQEKLLSALAAAHGKVVGVLFKFDCDEMLLRTTCIGYDSRQRAANILVEGLRATMRQLNKQLDVDERILGISLSSISPDSFAEVESVIKSYAADPHPLTRGMEALHACHSALEKLCLDVSDDVVHAYWSLYARIQNVFVTVTSKDKFLTSARSLILAGIRAEQAENLRRAAELVGSIANLEALKDAREAFDNEVLVQRKLASLRTMQSEVESLRRKERLLHLSENKECTLVLAPAVSKMEHLTSLWSTVANWNRDKEFWMLQIFQNLNADHMLVMVQTFGDKLTQLVHDNTSFGASQEALFSVADEVNEMLTRLPLLLRLRHPGVRRIHWIELASKTGCWAFHDGAEGLTLKSVLELPLLTSHQEIIWTVLERAAEEYNQEVCLEKMEEEMRRAVHELSPYNPNGGRQMLLGSELVSELLDDQLVAAGCMLQSPFAKALEGPVRAWRDKLHLLLNLLEGLLSFQKWFKILWPIFQSVNIRQQLLEESGKFMKIDSLWNQVLDIVAQRRCFMHLCESNLILEEVPRCIGTMEGIMCSLIHLLERKRAIFPRFFFLSNDELLQVLSHEQNPKEIQYYLCKCFCDLYSIGYSSRAQVTGMWIEKAEYLPFLEPIMTIGRPIEEWMVAVEQEMKTTLTHAILERLKELQTSTSSVAKGEKQEPLLSVGSSKSSHLLSATPAPQLITRLGQVGPKTVGNGPVCGSVCQICIVAANVTFCSQVEMLLSRKRCVVKELQVQLNNLTEEMGEHLAEIKSCASEANRGTHKSLVLLLIYFREIISSLMSSIWIGVESFEWQRRLRYYWHLNGDCHVGIMDMDRVYGCELINYQNRLVMTSLTEKCFLGLLHAFSLGLGGSVTGAAGVGKTESIKDCAKAVGKHCIVMSCSEEFDHLTIANVLKGMASGGLWLCLNEFECLRVEVVSILTQQLLAIQHAVATKAQRFSYEGFGLQLNPSFAICTTKPNLAAGYANAHAHSTQPSFRSITMMMPDCSMIVQVLLTAEGICDPVIVAQKLTLCFKLASEQLSFEDNHCDFGLRAMRAVIKWMSVLNSAPGAEKQPTEGTTVNYQGDLMLCKTLQQYCLPRLVGDGYVLFSNLLSDLFPHLKMPPLCQKGLEASINSSLAKRGLISHESLVQKCLQLHQVMKVHRGVLLVGGSGTGKTQCFSTLSHAMNLMTNNAQAKGRPDQTHPLITVRVVNPSAISTAHLFGSANSVTQSWQDGIMPNVLQECEATRGSGGAMWMVLDGNMDSIWLEHASTMLDDTGLLCLNNGKRILLPSIETFNMLFEVENLKSVSPGTVSRCGIILMDPEEHSWKRLVSSWLQRCPATEFQNFFQELFDRFLTPCLEVSMRCSELPMGHVGLINNLLNFLEAGFKLTGIWSDHSLRVEDRQPILQISGLESNKSKIESDVKTNEVSAKSSIEKLGQIKLYITQRQKEVRDAVNWRRLHYQRLLAYASQDTQEEGIIDDRPEKTHKPKYQHKGEEIKREDATLIPTLDRPVLEANMGSLFLFGLVWSIGGHLNCTKMGEQFEKVVREAAAPYLARLGPLPNGSMYDYYYDMEAHTWKSWEELLIHSTRSLSAENNDTPTWPHITTGNGSQVTLSLERGALYVPTVETLRMEYLAHSLSKFSRPVLLVGGPGTGKTVVAAQLLHQHAAIAKCQVVGLTLNSTSCGATLHDVLRPKLANWKRGNLTPAVNGKMVVFVDDLNIGQLHVKKEAPALQFLRFLIEQKGWYGLPMDASFTAVDGLVHLAAMTQLGSSYISTSPLARLFRHYFIIHSPVYSPSSLYSIFRTALKTCSYQLDTGEDIAAALACISKACVEVFSILRSKIPHSIDQSPSLLSLHDLFRIRRLLVLGSGQTATSLQSFFHFWAYEFCRMSCDRLKSTADRSLVVSALHTTTEEVWKLRSDDQRLYLESLINEEQQPIFGTYFRDTKQGNVLSWSHYEEVTCRQHWTQTMLNFLASYTVEEHSKTPIVLFPGAVSHLSRLLNILRLAEGHALLLGYSGVGRSSLARLSSYILGYTLFEVQVNGNYKSQQWTVDLRNLLKTCSLRVKPTVFLIVMQADSSIQKHIMEDLNLIVHCGEVDHLKPKCDASPELSLIGMDGFQLALSLLGEEEKYYIQQELQRMEETSMSCSNYNLGSDREQFLNTCFTNRLKENLHLVICAENAANKDSTNSSSIASTLISQHFIVDYYDKWTPVALQAVAKVTLLKHELVRNLSALDLELLTRSCSMIHNISNELAAGAPSKGFWRLVGMPSYHEMLQTFGRLSATKGQEVDRHLHRLETGLQKLQSTRLLVENMQHELQELIRCKDHTNSNMDGLLLSISEEQVQLEKALEEVATDDRVASEEAETCKQLAQEAQDQVQEVAPEVLTAIKQLSQLNKKDISELKSFTQPPPRLLTVLEALCIILKREPKHIKLTTLLGNPKNEGGNSYWPIARDLLSQVDFVKMLLSFNKDTMENCTMEKLKPYMENPLFKPEKVRRISVACRSICVWIRAMYNYHFAKTVKMEPRIERLKIANLNLDLCKEKLEEARRRLATAEQNLTNLRSRYDDASSKKDRLAKMAEDSEVKVQRAIRLIGRLDGECSRWNLQVDELTTKRKNVVGDAILASGIVSYLGSFPASFRSNFITKWQEGLQEIRLTFSTNFSLVTFYTTPQDIKGWAAAGLPPDDHSLENATIVCNSSRLLLLLDPQKQVSKWISSIENPHNIVTVDINSPRILEEANSCSLKGQLLMVENIGNETPPSLLKQLTVCRNGGHLTNMKSLHSECVQQGGVSTKQLHCQCILLTYEQGFNYSDEVNLCGSLNVVDFSITFHGLCSQLLSIAAEKERLDLEEERTNLMHQRLLLNCRLQEIEDHILTLLQGVMVTILDDEILEEALSKATATYADIQAKLARAAATEEAVELTRKRHLPVAQRAAILYSCVADVSRLESVYQWTLPWFKRVYSTSMQRTSALNPVDFPTRLDYLISKITIAIFRKICSGLLHKHQNLFGLLVVFRLAQTRQDVDQEEWMFLLKGEIGASLSYSDECCPPWLEPASNEWKQLQALSKFPRFKGLIEDLRRECWQHFYDSTHSHVLPAPWQERLGPFRSLLVLRCLRLDMMMEAFDHLVKEQLNLTKEDLAEISVEDAYEESSTETPVTCIFKGVVTPLDEITTCAKRRNMLKRLWVFSLDQCQGPKMLDAIKEAATWGKWVLLQNCHANIPWINNSLRVVLDDVKSREIHDSFRLWLTTMPTVGRPPYLLADSVKIVVEPAKGVKSKVMQILMNEQADEVYRRQWHMRIEANHVEHSGAFFQLALFHSLVQERAHFGSMGWNVPMQLDHTVFNLAKVEVLKLNDEPATASKSSLTMKSLKELSKSRERAREKNKMNCVQYMVTKIVYGGYIIDDWDEYSINHLFQHCFNSSKNGNCGNSVNAYLPKEKGTLQEFLKHAQNLPELDDPEIMGLPKDAVINRAREDTQELLQEALILETSKESFLAPSTSVFDTKRSLILQCFLEINKSVATPLNEHTLRAQAQQNSDPFRLLLLQEVKRYNRLTSSMRRSIADAEKAIEGSGDITPNMEAFCGSIIAGQATTVSEQVPERLPNMKIMNFNPGGRFQAVPELWLSSGYASLKPLASWIRDFHKRIDYMKGWIENGVPAVIWISALFFPQALFAATLQNFARSQKIPLSSIHLDVIMMDTNSESKGEPEGGCYISGLYLEGARWDPEAHVLAECEPKHLLSKMCTLQLRPRTLNGPNAAVEDDTRKYCCPIYTTQARNGLRHFAGCSYVGTINLPTGSMTPMYWALRGVALICSRSD